MESIHFSGHFISQLFPSLFRCPLTTLTTICWAPSNLSLLLRWRLEGQKCRWQHRKSSPNQNSRAHLFSYLEPPQEGNKYRKHPFSLAYSYSSFGSKLRCHCHQEDFSGFFFHLNKSWIKCLPSRFAELLVFPCPPSPSVGFFQAGSWHLQHQSIKSIK